MKNTFSFRWFLRPEGLLALLSAFWAFLYVLIVHFGYDVSVFIFLTIHWPEPTISWPLISLVFAVIYYLTRQFRQLKILQYFHVASLFAVPVVLYLWSPLLGNSMDHYSFANEAMKQEWERDSARYVKIVNSVIVPGGGIFIVAGQLAFAINMIVGFIRGKKENV